MIFSKLQVVYKLFIFSTNQAAFKLFWSKKHCCVIGEYPFIENRIKVYTCSESDELDLDLVDNTQG